jgi:hypothetical protein
MDEHAEAPPNPRDALAERRAELLRQRQQAVAVGTTASVRAVNQRIDAFNALVREAGRPDLTIPA